MGGNITDLSPLCGITEITGLENTSITFVYRRYFVNITDFEHADFTYAKPGVYWGLSESVV